MELGKVKNLLQPENAKYIPLAAWGIVRGLAAMAIYELSGGKDLEERTAASIQYYSTGEEDGK